MFIMIFFMWLISCFFLVSFIWFFVFVLNLKCGWSREKNSGFECGFDYLVEIRLPFSIHFFLVAIIFVIFDIELVLIMPLIFVGKLGACCGFFFFFFFFIIFYSFFYEWYCGSLDWVF